MSEKGRARAAAIALLHKCGAHLVLCNNKKIAAYKWKDNPAALDDIIAHRGLIGIIPSSIGCVVLDSDTDTAEDKQSSWELINAKLGKPAIAIASRRPHRGHYYYRWDGKRDDNADWKYGEFRCANYIVVHDLLKLAAGISDLDSHQVIDAYQLAHQLDPAERQADPPVDDLWSSPPESEPVWHRQAYRFSRSGLPYAMFDAWCKRGDGYNEADNRKKYEIYSSIKRQIRLGARLNGIPLPIRSMTWSYLRRCILMCSSSIMGESHLSAVGLSEASRRGGGY